MISNPRGFGLLAADPTPEEKAACTCPEGIARLLSPFSPAERVRLAAEFGLSVPA